MKKSLVILGVMFLMSSTTAWAKIDFGFNKYFTIDSVQLTDVTNRKGENYTLPPISVKDGYVPYLDETILVVDKLIALGTKIWNIVEKGKPVVYTEYIPSISVLPVLEGGQDADAFYDMTGWSFPKTKIYEVIYKNVYRMTVVKFKYAVTFQYGGSYLGAGDYLTAASVTPVTLDVAWGYTFNASSFLDTITNHGSTDFPVAGATLGVSHTVKTILKEITTTSKFHISGDGQIMQLM